MALPPTLGHRPTVWARGRAVGAERATPAAADWLLPLSFPLPARGVGMGGDRGARRDRRPSGSRAPRRARRVCYQRIANLSACKLPGIRLPLASTVLIVGRCWHLRSPPHKGFASDLDDSFSQKCSLFSSPVAHLFIFHDRS